MDVFKELMQIFADTEGEVYENRRALENLLTAMHDKRKFRIQVNGIGGKVVNWNIQTQKNGRSWEHISIKANR